MERFVMKKTPKAVKLTEEMRLAIKVMVLCIENQILPKVGSPHYKKLKSLITPLKKKEKKS